MNTSRKILLKLIEETPDHQLSEAIDFMMYLKMKKEKKFFRDLEKASESSLEFWDNDRDDQVWNNV